MIRVIKLAGNHKLTREEYVPLIGQIKGILYVRVSTDGQVEKYSLTSQIEECTSYAEKSFGYTDKELLVCVEEGESGDDPNRPALNNALFLLSAGVGKKLIVLHPDRLSRSLSLQTSLSEKIWSMGCDIDFVQFELDPNNPESVLMYNIQGSIAQYNKAKILANSKRGRMKKVQEQKLMGIKKLFGYTYNKENDQLDIHEDEKKVFLRIVKMVLEDDRSASEIAKILSLESIPAPLGDVWYQSTISKMLKNEVYTGVFYYGKTTIEKQKDGTKKVIKTPKEDWIAIKVPALIDKKTFDLLQKKIVSLTKVHSGRPSDQGLVRSIAKCGRCCAPVSIGAPSKNKNGVINYYVCHRKAVKGYKVGTGEGSGHFCIGKNWRVDIADNFVWEKVKNMVRDYDKLVIDIIISQADTQKICSLQQKRDVLTNSINEKQEIIDRYIDLYAMGHIKTKHELELKIEPSQKQIDELERNLSIIEDNLRSLENEYDEIDYVRTRLQQYKVFIESDAVPPETKKLIIQSIVKKVELKQSGEICIITAWDTVRFAFRFNNLPFSKSSSLPSS